ncbi:MAG: biopolymer transporter ExbD [Alteromonadaceae bacterium]|uniref:ExbD/TolR family protein n=1 Tax=Marinobacter sp. V034 TaxID=3459610 RepID=UPI000C5CAE2C|nr:biopolymer transporter ExbD [Alteromonadaceae bacterium]MBH84722.1 biopolymer transporter ExbD [Alteromonadaceae bacterium]|tara:strand:+ start:4668 stop:5075 length:408 start_codon:yes stop_codon:yes gene_type:complete
MQLVEPRPYKRLPIKITPLIDVVFILLVFFMVTSRLVPTSSLALDNATASTGTQTGDPLPELVLHRNGQLDLDGKQVSPSAAVDALRRRDVREVNLSTDKDVALSTFTESLTMLQSAGLTTHWSRSDVTDDTETP